MSRHIFCIRMLDPDYLGGRPIEALFLYEAESSTLTIDDFIKINSNNAGCKMICYFYGASMTVENFTKKYSMTFRTDLLK